MRADRGSSVSSTLRSPTVAGVLDRLHAAPLVEDEPAKERVRAQLGERLAQAERYELYGDAPLAITREVGELLYVLALGGRARRIVEFAPLSVPRRRARSTSTRRPTVTPSATTRTGIWSG
jgi:hypothetical protein